ncbi:MAG: transposase IS605 [Mycoplasmataceae bacterium RV_VA103A]|nr:MAG: transposase IS605 [Mycoplasmataceae bacterium RV_VA103A]KLL05321.1 MAG: transposase IS605 [Mycoplasmataceae bacterium RV_VA103A]
MLKKCFQYRLNLKARTEQELVQIIAECCWLYNHLLQIRRERDQNKQKQPTKSEQEKLLIELKERRPQLRLIFSQVLQNVANRVNETWKNYRQHKRINLKAGYPRFKPLSKYNSFTYKQFGFKLKRDKIILSCGRQKEELILNVRLHRELEGKTKTLSIVHKNGKYYACFANEVEPKLLPKTNKKVGVDLGLIDFCALDNGKKYPNPRIYKKETKKLIEAQQRVDRKEKGSNNQKKARLLLAKKWERLVNQAKHYSYQIANELVKKYDYLGMEDLKAKKMIEDRKNIRKDIRKSIQQVRWNTTQNIVARKVEENSQEFVVDQTGGQLVKINPAYTSQTCSFCDESAREKIELSQRVYECWNCGKKLDRDVNSARNILKLAELRFGASLRT